MEVAASGRPRIEGTISPTPNGNDRERWLRRRSYSDPAGTGGNVMLGRGVDASLAKIYAMGAIDRSWTEFATGGSNRETEVAAENPEHLGRCFLGDRCQIDSAPEVDCGLPNPLIPFAHRRDHRCVQSTSRLQERDDRRADRHRGPASTGRSDSVSWRTKSPPGFH